MRAQTISTVGHYGLGIVNNLLFSIAAGGEEVYPYIASQVSDSARCVVDQA